MSIKTQLTDVINTIPCSGSGTITLSTYIDSIGTMVDSSLSTCKVFGGCQ